MAAGVDDSCDSARVTASDREGLEERLRAKLEPLRIRSTLAFAALYQLTHEMLKSAVLDDVKGFYGYLDVHGGVWVPEDGEQEYRRRVLDLDRKSAFRASLLWLQDAGGLDAAEVERLDAIYAHRHELTHELGRYLIDPYYEPDVDLFVDALRTLRKVCRFWTEIERDLGTFDDYPDLDLDDVIPSRLAVLELCLSAYLDGLSIPEQEGATAGSE